MKRLLVCVVMAAVGLLPSTADAGGWAVASLDPIPPVAAGQPVEVGFRLLQHGQTPVVAGEWPGATIGLGVRAGGVEWFVPATMEGEAGHYVATVDVPADASELAIAVQMRNGLVVEQAWVAVTVGAADGSGAGSGPTTTWVAPVFGLAAAGCAAMVVVELRSMRRRRSAITATPAA